MQFKEKENLIFARLFPNEDLFNSLKEICKKTKIKTGVIISGIGQLKNFELGYFKQKGNYCPQSFKKPFELLSLNGNIIKDGKDYKFHLHSVLSDEDKKVIGGHLLKGQVEVTNEIVILKSSAKLKRKKEKETGLEGLFIK
jgi:predicted DNA-binding protein with PD1-like motif